MSDMSNFNERIANLSPEKMALLERNLLKKGNSSQIESRGICRRGTTGPCALSFAQERLWFLDQLEPGSSAYNIPLAIRLSGQLNVAALEKSLGEILRRHEVLRTTFSTENEQPVQRIAPVAAFSISRVDLGALSEERRKAEVLKLAAEEASRPFDLTAGPLLRATLLRLTGQEHVFLLTMHHIVSDGWSRGVLNREMSALYEAFSNDSPSPPDLPIQYADFAIWQRQWLQGERLNKQLAFWKEHLGELSPLELPTDRPRPPVQTIRGASHEVRFSPALTEALRKLSRGENVTFFMTLLAAFQCLLHRYTGKDDIVVGTPIANRNHAELEGLIGFFVNTLVMRTDTSGNPAFRELLKRVRKAALDAYAHQDLPFERLVKELQPDRDLSLNPLFQVSFALQNAPLSPLALSGLTLTPIEAKSTRTKFDLEVYIEEMREGLKGVFVYNADLFDRATIGRMIGHFETLLEGIIADPDMRLSKLAILPEAERHQLLVEWNDTAVDYPGDKCIHDLFEEQVERTPDAVAVIFEDRQLTYRQLNSKANQLAHYLRKQGVGPEVLVGLCVERSLEMIIGIFGILKAGGAYVPLDPMYPKERLTFMLEDSQAHLLLTDGHLISNLSIHTAHVLDLNRDWPSIAGGPVENPAHTALPGNLIYVIYTSGSTGRPKGCCNIHRGVGNMIRWSQETLQMSATDRMLQTSSFSFDISAWEIFWTLTSGATLVLTKPGGHMDPGYLIDLIDSRQITIVHFVPSMLSVLLKEDGVQRCLSLQRVFCGGEALSAALQQRFFSRLEAQLHNLYGPTEAAIFAMHWQCQKQGAPCRPHWPTGGKYYIYILDDYLEPAPVGVIGELHIGGLQVAAVI
jgi:amino acid adenylation domain-containing protein